MRRQRRILFYRTILGLSQIDAHQARGGGLNTKMLRRHQWYRQTEAQGGHQYRQRV